VIKRLWNWIVGDQSINLNISVEVKGLDKIIKTLSKFENNQGIIKRDNQIQNSTEKILTTSISQKNQPKRKKKLDDDPINAEDIAEIFSSDGILKAIDKTGNDVISQSEGKSTDDKMSSLKKLSKKKGIKNGKKE